MRKPAKHPTARVEATIDRFGLTVNSRDFTTGDPQRWTEEQIDSFISQASEDEIIEVHRRLLDVGDAESIAALQRFLSPGRHEYLKGVPSQLAARALIGLGPTGIVALTASLLSHEKRVRYAATLLALLWEVSRTGGLAQTKVFGPTGFLDLPLPDGTKEAAGRAVRDIFAQATVDPHAFGLVTNFAQQQGLAADLAGDSSEPGKDMSEIMGLFGEATIKLSRSVLDEFRRLIAEERREEDYQRFLATNPVLLDPLAAEVIPKQRLGAEFATDYAIRRHDGRWILVEIERPQDHPFNSSNDFQKRFVHGFGQVLDFQGWVDHNVAYAKTLMADIVAPRGMLVIGLHKKLDDAQRRKLASFVDNSQRIEVHAFDDLLARAESLYESLHHRSSPEAQKSAGGSPDSEPSTSSDS